MASYHTPVLLHDCLEGLCLVDGGTYVDLTYGGGGHSREILKNLTSGKLIGFDQDEDALVNLIDDERFLFVGQNFRYLKANLRLNGIKQVDGVLADLGVSSFQFNESVRGFSIRFDGDLDMRMDARSGVSAKEVLNTYSEEDLYRIFKWYGEVGNSGRLVREIVQARQLTKIDSVFQFKEMIEDCVDKRKPNQYYAKVFQALRIEVNDELVALREMLEQAVDVLAVGGRLVVMSYHSLEDRLVKNFIKSGNFKGKVEQDFFGNVIKPLKAINNKVIVPSEEEIEINNRARSAKLRIAEKL